jgi:uncharacterized damage-inducible protein DinB
MKNVFFIILMMICIISAKGQSNLFLKEVAQKWSNAQDYTLKIVELMPEDKFGFKPTDEEMAFFEQLAHISDNMLWLSSTYLSSEKRPIAKSDFEGKNKAENILLLKQSFEFVEKSFQNIDIESLNTEVELFKKPFTKRQIISLINDHLTHHRAQMIIYLRLNQVKPPQYIGW